jgi:hypothetical protein
MIWLLLIAGAVVLIGIVWLVMRRGGSVSDAERFAVSRRWGWELALTEAEETALMQGLRAYYDAGHSLFIQGEYGVLRVYAPQALVSLHLLGERFRAMGAGAIEQPAPAVQRLMERLTAAEEPGVLHLAPAWLDGTVDGMDRIKFVDAVREVGAPVGTPEIVGWFSDEESGYMEVVVLDRKPAELVAAEEAVDRQVTGGPVTTVTGAAKAIHDAGKPEFQEAYWASQGEKSRHTNTLLVDLARVLAGYRQRRAAQPTIAVRDAVRATLTEMVGRGAPGVTWTRPPTPNQQQVLLSAIRAAHA